MNSGEYQGEWWLPESPDSQIRGNLIVSTSDLTLEVEEEFFARFSIDSMPPIPFVHGRLHDGHIITLYSSSWIGSKTSEGFKKTRYNVDYIFEGAYFDNDNQLKFKTISITLDHLDDWIWTSSINMTQNEGKTLITVDNDRRQSFKINEYFELEIYTSTGPDTMSIPLKELTIKQNSHLKLYPTENFSLSKSLDTVRHLQNFFSFALGNIVRVTSIACEIVPALIPEDKVKVPFVDVTYLTITSDLPERRVDQIKTHFRYIDIGGKFPTLLKNWFDKKDRLGVVLNLYFKNMYVQEPFATERFMDLSRAIEVYHRRSFKSYIDAKEVHDERIKKIEEAIPEYSKWLKANLSFSNEKKLQMRLDEIIEQHPSTLKNSTPESIAKFTQILRQTRNYHTHYGDPGSQALVDSSKLSRFSQSLKIILDVIIMNEMGFDDNEICGISHPLRRALPPNWMDAIIDFCKK